MTDMNVSISGLTKLDALEMEDAEGVRFEEVPVPRGAHGDLTLLTAYFAMSALSTLAAYLLRKHNGMSFEETVMITHKDGRREERRIRYQSSSSEAPEAAIVKQIRGSSL
jgi:hypothetical protein